MKRGIIFDMDGTLWDAGESIAKAWNLVLRHMELAKAEMTADDIHSIMGKTIEGIADALFGEFPDTKMEITRACLEYENEYLEVHGGELFDGLEEVLLTLKKEYPLYIVSNCEKGYIEVFLKYYGFGKYFEDFESHGNTLLPKGQNIKLVAERNGLTEAIYIGDTQGDYDASKEAGVEFIHASYGFGMVDAEVPVVQNIRQLPQMIQTIFEKK